jgi:hypothetical protein
VEADDDRSSLHDDLEAAVLLQCLGGVQVVARWRHTLIAAGLIPRAAKKLTASITGLTRLAHLSSFSALLTSPSTMAPFSSRRVKPYLPALLLHLVTGKMYKSNELQIRMTNNPAEPAFTKFVNSRKSNPDKENDGQYIVKRSIKDTQVVHAMIEDLRRQVPSSTDVPDMQAVINALKAVFNVDVAVMIEASRWKWGEPESDASRMLLRASNIVALYCSLANKARSFNLTVGTRCEVPLPLGPAY